MSPNVHKASKTKFLLRTEPEYRKIMEKLMRAHGDENLTELIKRLLKEEANRKGIK